MLARLREDFVTSWVLGQDLERIAAETQDPALRRLCTLLRENYGYPVDTVLVTPGLEVVGHLNANEPETLDPTHYRNSLARGLALARGEPVPAPEVSAPAGDPASQLLRPTPTAPTASLLDVFRTGPAGEPVLRYVTLDLSAFPEGGALELVARVGASGPAARFELCASAPGDPSVTRAERTLERLVPGESATLTLAFEPGRAYGLAVLAAPGAAAGATSAFLATVTVRAP